MEYECKICNKKYSSYQSLWIHNKKFHTKNIIIDVKNVENVDKSIINVVINKKLQCKFCLVFFKSQSNKCQHEKNYCKKKDNINSHNKDNNYLEIKKIELENLKEQNEMIRLKIKLQNCKKIDNKTFKAVNNMLMERSFKNSNNNNINCNNTNNIINNTINNNIILSLGNEDLPDNLTSKEKRAILDRKYCSLEKITELVHCGKYDKFKNILITNLKDNYAYKYDDNLHYFLTVSKNELLNDIVSNRICDIEKICDELSNKKKIDNNTKEIIEMMIDKINDEKTTYYDDDGETKYPNYKSYKINNIKIILYNNNNKITRDIELIFSKYVNEKPIAVDLIPDDIKI